MSTSTCTCVRTLKLNELIGEKQKETLSLNLRCYLEMSFCRKEKGEDDCCSVIHKLELKDCDIWFIR